GKETPKSRTHNTFKEYGNRSRTIEFIEAAESLSINDFSGAPKAGANKIGWQAVACQPSKHLTSPLGRNHEAIQNQ
ncbi:MAG: hypothetical protein L0Y75_03865, partial [Acidobacteria bacterium]|nr:hypothetical protein [Acidobacteriota bacterium]